MPASSAKPNRPGCLKKWNYKAAGNRHCRSCAFVFTAKMATVRAPVHRGISAGAIPRQMTDKQLEILKPVELECLK